MSAKQQTKLRERSTFSLVLGDANAMGLWVFFSSVFEELGALLAAALNVSPLVAGLAVLCTGLAVYDPICAAVGGRGASFNPSQNFAFAAAGRGSLALHALRSLGQVAGGVIGAFAALRAVPSSWQGKFGNYSHGVVAGTSVLHGAAAEAILSFVLNIVILWTLETRHKRAAGLAPFVATCILIPLGATTSGPFMNPAFAFSWFFHLSGPQFREHFLVYWVGCLAGSYLAGLAWWLLTSPAKKARHSKARLAASRQAAERSKPQATVAGSQQKKTD